MRLVIAAALSLAACAGSPAPRPDDPAAAPRVLVVLTSHGQLGDTGRDTGFYLSELSHVYYPLREAGIELTLASIEGGEPPMDGVSRDDALNARFLDDPEAMAALRTTRPLSEVDASTYDAVYFPGGHGTMWDLPADPDVQRVIREVLARDGTVAAVCHGPAAFVGATDADGRPLVEGRRVSAFSDAEERDRELHDVVPFLLESRLRAQGATLEPAPPFTPQVVEDGPLLTGQNPASAGPLAERLIDRVR